MRPWILFLATGAFSGLSPFAPGTAGSLLASVILLFVLSFSNFPFFSILVLLILIGTWVAAEAERIYNQEDASQIVIDEIIGMMVSVAFLPAGWKTVLAAFLLFRVFDILKPPPARNAERVGDWLLHTFRKSAWLSNVAGGIAVVLDDVIAGIYTNICLQILFAILGKP